ncbi:MAG: hypothetical protein WA821_18190 [Anaerolineales bacterium]
MPKDTLTFVLEGEVTLNAFASALSDFNALLNGLSREAGGNAAIEWRVDELYAGSAVATFQGVYEDQNMIEKVVDAYETVGEALANGQEIPFSEAVRRSARNITNLLNGKITSLRFETPAREFIVSGKARIGEKAPPMKYSLGTVKGTVQTLSMRRKLSFTIWDALFDKPVNCYLKEGEEERMRNAWGKRAVVSGRIGRQSESGRPIVIREVKDIRILEDADTGSYKRARGVLPWQPGDEKPEETLRRLRNA